MAGLGDLTPAVSVIGWTLVHFSWQAVAIFILFRVAHRFAKERSAQLRYLMGCGAMAGMMLAALATAIALSIAYYAPDAPKAEQSSLVGSFFSLKPASEFTVSSSGRIRLPHETANPTLKDRAILEVSPWLPYAVDVWVLGLVLNAVMQLKGLAGVNRIVLRAVPAAEEKSHQNLARKFGIRRVIRYVQTADLDSPATVGWLRPVILLPIAIAGNFSVAEVDAFVAHELAHIRRYDYLVNLAQTVVEIIFFYHPCVWILSREIRADRELCCDAMATRIITDSRNVYTRALVKLSDRINPPTAFVMAATGGSLLQRVTALAKAKPGAAPPKDLSATLVTILVCIACGTLGMASITERAARLRDHEMMAHTPPADFIYDALHARNNNNADARQALIDAIALLAKKPALDDPRLEHFVSVIDRGCDPEMVWNELGTAAPENLPTQNAIAYPANWPFQTGEVQYTLGSFLWRGAILKHDAESPAWTRAALIVTAMHREAVNFGTLGKIVYAPKFDALSGMTPADVRRLREYVSIASDKAASQSTAPSDYRTVFGAGDHRAAMSTPIYRDVLQPGLNAGR